MIKKIHVFLLLLATVAIGVNCQGDQPSPEPIVATATATVAPVQKYIGQDMVISSLDYPGYWLDYPGYSGLVWLELLAPPSPGEAPIRLLVANYFRPLIPNGKDLTCYENQTVFPIEMVATFNENNEFTTYAHAGLGGCAYCVECVEEVWRDLKIQGTISTSYSTLRIDAGQYNSSFDESQPDLISHILTATLTAVPLSQPSPHMTCQQGDCQIVYDSLSETE